MSGRKLELFYDGSKWIASISEPVTCRACGNEIKHGSPAYIIIRKETNEWVANCEKCTRPGSEAKNVNIPIMMDRITKVKGAYPCIVLYPQEESNASDR